MRWPGRRGASSASGASGASNAWTWAGWSGELRVGGSVCRTVAGRAVVLRRDAHGRVQAAEADGPAPAVYPLAERRGTLWLWFGDPALARSVEPPRFAPLAAALSHLALGHGGLDAPPWV